MLGNQYCLPQERLLPQSEELPSERQFGSYVKKVAIRGAGVAGLQTARALQKWGIDFTIFDEAPDVGGCALSRLHHLSLSLSHLRRSF